MKKHINKILTLVNNYFVGNSTEKLMFEFKGIIKYIPLIICGGFFGFTVIIFAFGPLDWKINNEFELYSFLVSCIIALVFGYILAIKKGKTPNNELNLNTNNILLMCSIVFLILYIPTVFSRTGKFYPDFLTGLYNAGKAYKISYEYTLNGSKVVEYLRIVFSPFLIMIVPLTLFFMPKLSKKVKIVGLFVMVCMLILGISQGINKISADFTSQIVLFFTLLLFSNYKKGFNIKFRLKILSTIILICALFFMYYSSTMVSRIEMDISKGTAPAVVLTPTDQNGSIINEKTEITTTIPETTIDSNLNPDVKPETIDDSINNSVIKYALFGYAVEKENYYLLSLLPNRIRSTALFLSSYVSHGYKGLSIAMSHKFTSSYGFGFSNFLTHNFLKIVGKENYESYIFKRTYVAKTSENGWVTGEVWSTFFVYPASDITFFGTVLVVFLIGYLFGLSWKDTLITKNIFAVVVFFNFCMMIFYFSANNQIFQSGETCVGFIVMIVLWFITRHFLTINRHFTKE
ncbi:MAG TPA: hypothetical protein VIK86_09565 [Candidatus Paceibacterota bacterium]